MQERALLSLNKQKVPESIDYMISHSGFLVLSFGIEKISNT